VAKRAELSRQLAAHVAARPRPAAAPAEAAHEDETSAEGVPEAAPEEADAPQAEDAEDDPGKGTRVFYRCESFDITSSSSAAAASKALDSESPDNVVDLALGAHHGLEARQPTSDPTSGGYATSAASATSTAGKKRPAPSEASSRRPTTRRRLARGRGETCASGPARAALRPSPAPCPSRGCPLPTARDQN